MRYLKAVAIGVGCSVAIVAAYLLLRDGPAARATTAAALPAVAPAAVTVGPRAAPLSLVPPASVRAAIVHEFHGVALPRALLERLVAGDVAGVARELARAADAAAAVELFDLQQLCATEDEGVVADLVAADGRAALEATGVSSANRATLGALIEEHRAWHVRFRPACAATAFDAAAIRARLQAAGLKGDGVSLERLSRLDPQPLVRLQSAALLGSPRAAFRVGLAELPERPRDARSWLEIAAKDDAEAAAYFGICLLAGCAGAADPVAARQALEAAARSGSLYALGVLASADSPDGARHWARTDEFLVPVAPRDLDPLGINSTSAYPWAALAASLAAHGCFGFEFRITAEALEARTRFERSLRPGELASAQTGANDLAAATLGTTRRALGCD